MIPQLILITLFYLVIFFLAAIIVEVVIFNCIKTYFEAKSKYVASLPYRSAVDRDQHLV